MIYSVANGDQGVFFDADGLQIADLGVWCDTETGVMEQIILNADGKARVDYVQEEVLRERRRYKAPLTFERMGSNPNRKDPLVGGRHAPSEACP